jgi:hypothetical protein
LRRHIPTIETFNRDGNVTEQYDYVVVLQRQIPYVKKRLKTKESGDSLMAVTRNKI